MSRPRVLSLVAVTLTALGLMGQAGTIQVDPGALWAGAVTVGGGFATWLALATISNGKKIAALTAGMPTRRADGEQLASLTANVAGFDALFQEHARSDKQYFDTMLARFIEISDRVDDLSTTLRQQLLDAEGRIRNAVTEPVLTMSEKVEGLDGRLRTLEISDARRGRP